MSEAMAKWLESLRGLRFRDARVRVRAAGYEPVGPVIFASQTVDPTRSIRLYPDPSQWQDPDMPDQVVWFAEAMMSKGG